MPEWADSPEIIRMALGLNVRPRNIRRGTHECDESDSECSGTDSGSSHTSEETDTNDANDTNSLEEAEYQANNAHQTDNPEHSKGLHKSDSTFVGHSNHSELKPEIEEGQQGKQEGQGAGGNEGSISLGKRTRQITPQDCDSDEEIIIRRPRVRKRA